MIGVSQECPGESQESPRKALDVSKRVKRRRRAVSAYPEVFQGGSREAPEVSQEYHSSISGVLRYTESSHGKKNQHPLSQNNEKLMCS